MDQQKHIKRLTDNVLRNILSLSKIKFIREIPTDDGLRTFLFEMSYWEKPVSFSVTVDEEGETNISDSYESRFLSEDERHGLSLLANMAAEIDCDGLLTV